MIYLFDNVFSLRFSSKLEYYAQKLLGESLGLAGKLRRENLHALVDVPGGAGEGFVV